MDGFPQLLTTLTSLARCHLYQAMLSTRYPCAFFRSILQFVELFRLLRSGLLFTTGRRLNKTPLIPVLFLFDSKADYGEGCNLWRSIVRYTDQRQASVLDFDAPVPAACQIDTKSLDKLCKVCREPLYIASPD